MDNQISVTKQIVKKASREDKAKALVAGVTRDENDVFSYAVPSQSDPSKVYEVRLQSNGYTCNCPDFERRGQVGGAVSSVCKHIIAVEMFNGDYEIEQTIKQMARGAP